MIKKAGKKCEQFSKTSDYFIKLCKYTVLRDNYNSLEEMCHAGYHQSNIRFSCCQALVTAMSRLRIVSVNQLYIG